MEKEKREVVMEKSRGEGRESAETEEGEAGGEGRRCQEEETGSKAKDWWLLQADVLWTPRRKNQAELEVAGEEEKEERIRVRQSLQTEVERRREGRGRRLRMWWRTSGERASMSTAAVDIAEEEGGRGM